MNDRRIKNLVRMAMEVEELESHVNAPALRLAGEPAELRRRAWFASGVGMMGIGLAAAAGLALVFALPAMMQPRNSGHTNNTSLATTAADNSAGTPKDNTIVRHMPTSAPIQNANHAALAVVPTVSVAADRVDPDNVERSMIMAIYRGARGQMQCVKMKPHEWSENKCLTDVTSQELKCVSVGQACTASADHALVVALSGPQKSLPRNESDAVHLATCILGSPCENDSKCLSLNAAQCVPEGVSVKIETVADSR